jgi:hypothetical protein
MRTHPAAPCQSGQTYHPPAGHRRTRQTCARTRARSSAPWTARSQSSRRKAGTSAAQQRALRSSTVGQRACTRAHKCCPDDSAEDSPHVHSDPDRDLALCLGRPIRAHYGNDANSARRNASCGLNDFKRLGGSRACDERCNACVNAPRRSLYDGSKSRARTPSPMVSTL